MFANDHLIFCKANRKTARHVKTILDNYCNVSGQVVNLHKSMVKFSKGFTKFEKNMKILIILQVPSSSSITYLRYQPIDNKRKEVILRKLRIVSTAN